MCEKKKKLIAHVLQFETGEWDKPHLLEEHLKGVAQFAEIFAKKFRNGDWATASGLLHDLGKGTSQFQTYIRKKSGYGGYDPDAHLEGQPGKVVHSTHGAIWANSEWIGIGKILAYLIAGHHGGLPDWSHVIGSGGNLADRLIQEKTENLPVLDIHIKNKLTQKVVMPETKPCGTQLPDEAIHLWIRMLYSCLVDADFLDTERYMNEEQYSLRGIYSSLYELRERIDIHMAKFDKSSSDVNKIRDSILQQCRDQAKKRPGLFTLTVPTGGGKTLSSMAFALDHALEHGKDRVIMVIPYTSIIEQTAKVYKDIFGDENVIEHHSSLDPDKESRQARLATENWDAPIIVTTNVQLFESMFAARSSACRKLHNITNSVVIIDEVQMLPSDYLKPILQSINTLVNNFKVSMVLCSATQPAITGNIGTGVAAFTGLRGEQCREMMINPNPEQLAAKLKRVEIYKLDKFSDWSLVASELLKHESFLCIVNTRRDCRELYELMPAGVIHLSANMCGEHRSQIIKSIRDKLKAGEVVQVVSTQLVEAGVDLDFPVVFRAMAGFDSIAQAAGRCNREGKFDKGQVFVFEPPRRAPIGFLRKGEQAGKTILSVDPDGCRNLLPGTFERYFQLFFGDVNTFDRKDMHGLLVKDATEISIQFRTASQEFKMIDNQNQATVIAKYKGKKTDSRDLISELKKYGPNKSLLRKLQRFSITLPEQAFEEVKSSFEEIYGIWCQLADTVYNDDLGFVGYDGEIPIC